MLFNTIPFTELQTTLQSRDGVMNSFAAILKNIHHVFKDCYLFFVINIMKEEK